MGDDKPMMLDEFRVMRGVGRVVLQLFAWSDGGTGHTGYIVKVGMTVAEARELRSSPCRILDVVFAGRR
jgi:hypothetical protein